MKSPCPELFHHNLQATWAQLNRRYFRNALPPIHILWSSRLTTSMGLFYSRYGPRTRMTHASHADRDRRVIRLSLPLFRQLYSRRQPGDDELIATLAHEMIHQWQYDLLKRRPNHGTDFRRMMRRMNEDGLQITVYHSLEREIDALARYVWRCRQCGYTYRRRRRTIQPRRHRCGVCRGPLQELERHAAGQGTISSYSQLVLDFDP
ncbi:MAG TPA: SprT family zinc-dependent metalloprotease [Nitrospiraceae bacterium]|nr:SprT family zinc-dependent metalloprotease [Nitrospiraceae bacterium]